MDKNISFYNICFSFRHYRSAQEETPTYTGGLSKQAREKLERLKKPYNRGVHYSTSDSKDKRDRYRDRRSCKQINFIIY